MHKKIVPQRIVKLVALLRVKSKLILGGYTQEDETKVIFVPAGQNIIINFNDYVNLLSILLQNIK